jgi:hypothetical protein
VQRKTPVGEGEADGRLGGDVDLVISASYRNFFGVSPPHTWRMFLLQGLPGYANQNGRKNEHSRDPRPTGACRVNLSLVTFSHPDVESLTAWK